MAFPTANKLNSYISNALRIKKIKRKFCNWIKSLSCNSFYQQSSCSSGVSPTSSGNTGHPLEAVWDAGFYSNPRQRKLGARCLLHQTSDMTSSYSCSTHLSSTKSSNTSLILIVRCNSSKDLAVTDSLLQIHGKNLSSFQTWVTNSQRLYCSVWFVTLLCKCKKSP